MLYFDHAATSPMREVALTSYVDCAKNFFANPGSIHQAGLSAQQLLAYCRQQLAQLIACQPEEIIFTAGGTQGNHLGIGTLLANLPAWQKEVLVSPLEHPCVYQYLASRQDIQVKKLPLNDQGVVSPEILAAAISQHTGLIIIQQINSVTGIIQPIAELAQVAQEKGCFFHCDFVQGAGKTQVPRNVTSWCVAGHKFGGPKASGFCYLKQEAKLKPMFTGVHQEFGYRPGTEDLPGIVAMVSAFQAAEATRVAQQAKYAGFNELIRQGLPASNLWPNAPIHPGICGIYLPEIYGETALLKLSEVEIYVATTSACNSHRQVDPVFAALNKVAAGQHYLRVSFGPEHQPEDIRTLIKAIKKIVND